MQMFSSLLAYVHNFVYTNLEILYKMNFGVGMYCIDMLWQVHLRPCA